MYSPSPLRDPIQMAKRSNNKSTAASVSRPTLSSQRNNMKKKKGKLAVNIDSSLFSGSLLYEKRAAPSAIGTRMKFTAQTRKSVSGGEIFIGTSALGPVPPTNSMESWEINAGLVDLFPQLAPEANLFSEYTFRKLHFRYVPSVGSQTQGRLVFTFNRNVQSAPPTSFTQAASFEGTLACNVWEDMVFMAEVGEKKYVRNAHYPSGSDPKTYDAGLFTMLLENIVNSDPNFEMGMILIDYEVFCSNRVLSPPLGAEIMLPRVLIPVSSNVASTIPEMIEFYFSQPVSNPLMSTQFVEGESTIYLGIPPGLWWLSFNGAAVPGSYAAIAPDSELNWDIGGGGNAGNGAYAEQVGSPLCVQGGFIDEDNYFQCNALIYVPDAATGDLSNSPNAVALTWDSSIIAGYTSGTTSCSLQHILTRLPMSAMSLFENPPIPPPPSAGPQMRRMRHRKARLSRKRVFKPMLPSSSSSSSYQEHDRDVVKLDPTIKEWGCEDVTEVCTVVNVPS